MTRNAPVLSKEEMKEKYPNAHAEALTWRRRRLGISLKQASDATEIPTEDLSQIERGVLSPTYEQLVKISDCYGYSLERLRENFSV